MSRFEAWRYEPPLDCDDTDPFEDFCRVFNLPRTETSWEAFEDFIGAEQVNA